MPHAAGSFSRGEWMMKASFNLPGFTLRPFTLNDLADYIELGLPTCAFMHGRPGIGMEAASS
jgi:hypothetical protein